MSRVLKNICSLLNLWYLGIRASICKTHWEWCVFFVCIIKDTSHRVQLRLGKQRHLVGKIWRYNTLQQTRYLELKKLIFPQNCYCSFYYPSSWQLTSFFHYQRKPRLTQYSAKIIMFVVLGRLIYFSISLLQFNHSISTFQNQNTLFIPEGNCCLQMLLVSTQVKNKIAYLSLWPPSEGHTAFPQCYWLAIQFVEPVATLSAAPARNLQNEYERNMKK